MRKHLFKQLLSRIAFTAAGLACAAALTGNLVPPAFFGGYIGTENETWIAETESQADGIGIRPETGSSVQSDDDNVYFKSLE